MTKYKPLKETRVTTGGGESMEIKVTGTEEAWDGCNRHCSKGD